MSLKEFSFLEIGRIWQKPIGPHPVCSCQVTVPAGSFEQIACWFMRNRGPLDVFVHALSGDDLKDHTDYTMWIGKEYHLHLEMFKS